MNVDYAVVNAAQAKKIALKYLKEIHLNGLLSMGLPEVDDRYHIWRIPIINVSGERAGEVAVDAKTALIIDAKTTSKKMIEKRLAEKTNAIASTERTRKEKYVLSPLRNTVAFGDSEKILKNMPAESVDLVFTSPPYYNARPEYSDFISYENYLLKMRKIIQQVHRVLADGRFFVLNVSPVLIRRTNRNKASKRIAVPFDFHRIFIEEGFEFIDDIIWVKPEGAGWATGRGRRFAADRNPLQYKAVPVTEYVLVYRKKSEKLIDWYIKNYPDKKTLKDSKIPDGYERTNLWKITPAHNRIHPAVFPVELAKKVIQYYSFKNDVVLDPFAGIGTVGEAASVLGRRFVLIEINKKYIDYIKSKIENWLKENVEDVNWINTSAPTRKFILTIA